MRHTELSVERREKTDIFVFDGDMSEVAALVEGGGKLHLAADENLFTLYGDAFCEMLKERYTLSVSVIPAGEESKSRERAARLQDDMFSAGITRGDRLAYLGGGVIGDLASYAAATYLRGIPVIGIPTSLLAMCDSAVGGKCGINHPSGKNLIGCIVQPERVIVNTAFLKTLPARYYADGMAEVIKYGYIFDTELLSCIERTGLTAEVIARCIAWKRRTVVADALDKGERMKLNFGHTVGHALERLGSFTQYGHGEAVAIGMDFALFCSKMPHGVRERYHALCRRYHLPFETHYSAEEIAAHLMHDKKNLSGAIHFILLREVGVAEIVPMRQEELLTALRAWKGE